jgi:CrcB protein
MQKLLLIGAAGLIGTLVRYSLSSWVDQRAQSTFPFGTLAVNLVGCFGAGFLFILFSRIAVSEELRLAVFTGFLGGFTTFSAYGLQTYVLVREAGALGAALWNVVLSNIAGLVLVWMGAEIGRRAI